MHPTDTLLGAPFDQVIAVDWSGAKTANGISIARRRRGGKAVDLVLPPNGKKWTRSDVVDWFAATMKTERVLVGVDFALSFPMQPATEWARSARQLWKRVDDVCQEQTGDAKSDLYARAFVDSPPFAAHFWTRGERPKGFRERTRETEMRCAEWGLGSPQTPFKLIGAKQVGLGSLAGMRVLHRVATQHDVAFFAWPFDGQLPSRTGAVVVEIFPRLFLREADMGNLKVRTPADLARVLAHFGARFEDVSGAGLSDHDTDALVSAAALESYARDVKTWTAPTPGAAFEGWIFGAKETA